MTLPGPVLYADLRPDQQPTINVTVAVSVGMYG